MIAAPSRHPGTGERHRGRRSCGRRVYGGRIGRSAIVVACTLAVAFVDPVSAREQTATPADRIPPLPVGPQVMLVDGGVIAGRLVSCDGSSVVVESLECGLVKLPVEVVSGWKASLAADRDRRQRPVPLERLAREGAGSAVAAALLGNDDVAIATTLAIAEAKATIGIEGVRDPVIVPLARVRAIAFPHAHAPRGDRPPATLVALRDGSRIAVVPHAAEGDRGPGWRRLVLAAPQAAGLAIECPSESVVATAHRDARVRSLEHEEFAGHVGGDPGDLLVGCIVPGRSLSGGPLRARGENAFGGFSMPGPGTATFMLHPPADRFEGRVAIDDASGQGGSLRVRILAGPRDGRRETIFEGGPIRGGDPPLAVAADSTGMEVLEIELESTGEGDDQSPVRTIWLDPILIAK